MNPRHIEIQVLADEHGNTIHLGERECSIQRRHQKVLEESPSPFVDATLRKQMGEVAVQAASAVGYTNAGTVEFLVNKDKNFYFLEMNTRLQVEHPVTELVTGLDLVQMQIRIAAGERLPFVKRTCISAGTQWNAAFTPKILTITISPARERSPYCKSLSGPGVRLDTGVYEGWTVPSDYDPLLAKLTAYGESREQAVSRLLRALDEMFVGGIQTNIELFRRILNDAGFRDGQIDTGFLDRLMASGPVGTNHEHSDDSRIGGWTLHCLEWHVNERFDRRRIPLTRLVQNHDGNKRRGLRALQWHTGNDLQN